MFFICPKGEGDLPPERSDPQSVDNANLDGSLGQDHRPPHSADINATSPPGGVLPSERRKHPLPRHSTVRIEFPSSTPKGPNLGLTPAPKP